MVRCFLGMSLILLVGCGHETKHPLVSERVSASQVRGTTCPMDFPKAGFCAKIDWVTGPTSEKLSSYKVSFWNKDLGSDTGPFVEPPGIAGSYLRMKCCGSLFFPKVKKLSEGVYLVSDAQFSEGSWEVYVQIKSASGAEKTFIPVSLGE